MTTKWNFYLIKVSQFYEESRLYIILSSNQQLRDSSVLL